MKTFFEVSDLIPKNYFIQANHFLISNVGYYENKGIEAKHLDVFEISCSIDEAGEFWSKPIRFISDGTTQNGLANILTGKGKKVIHANLSSHLRGGNKLMYRDIKDLPNLKIKSR